MSTSTIHNHRGNGMAEEGNGESEEQIKKQKLNISLLIIGVLVAGLSFAWHIIALFFKE
jgi:hypothetical protein